MPVFLSRLTLLATTTLLLSCLPEKEASAADRLELMERQIRAMQAEVQELKKERAAEHKRTSALLARQREETEANPYRQRAGYLPPPHLLQTAAPISILRRTPLAQDTPPSDRGIVSSWKDFQQASSQDEEVSIGGMKIGFPNGRPTFKTADGAYALSIGLAFQEDFGGFLGVSQRNGESRGNFNSFTSNSRRLRIPFSFRYKD